MPVDEGGPAFPTENLWNERLQSRVRHQGMSLRDYFAGQALSKIVDIVIEHAVEEMGDGPCSAADVWNAMKVPAALYTPAAWIVADAAIETRKGGKDEPERN